MQSSSFASTILHHAKDLTRAVDLARARNPEIGIIEMSDDMSAFKSCVSELLAVSPETSIAGAYRNDTFGPQVWEQAAQGAIFVDGLRAGASDFLRRPISTSDLRQLIERSGVQAPRGNSSAGTTLAFVSNKGGVGKSTLSVNVATRLAQHHPGETLLIDASLQMGVCATMLELKPTTTLLDTIREHQRLDSTLIRQLATPHECGLDLLAAPPDPVSATEVDDELLTRVLNLARRTYKYVVIDTFPMFDRIVMSTVDAADAVYVVLDNVVPSVLSITQFMKLLREIGCPTDKTRIIVNRMLRVPGYPTLEAISESIGQPVNYSLPFDKKVVTAANLGKPFALSRNRWSGVNKKLREIVREIESLKSSRSEVAFQDEESNNRLSDHEAEEQVESYE